MSAATAAAMAAESLAQYNLFTGGAEVIGDRAEPENLWLFDPDFGVVLPEDPAGQDIVITDGVSLHFPALAETPRRPPGSVMAAAPDLVPIFGKRPFVPDTPRVARSEDAAQLIIAGFGIGLGKTGERLQVRVRGKAARDERGELYEFPFFRLSEVVIASNGISFSSDLVHELCEHGIRLTFVERSGRPYAMLNSPTLTATVESRRAQLQALDDERGVEFARQIVRGKLRNQRHLLQYSGKYIRQIDPERFAALEQICRQLRQLEIRAREIKGRCMAEKRPELMGVEGAAGRLYWDGFQLVVKADFPGRRHRGATDEVNSLLNYGYGILYAQVWGAVVNAGLEPFAGFLHVDRPGKPSLVLDMVEEFRQPVVDRTIIAWLNLGKEVGMKDGLLDDRTRQEIGQKVVERLCSPEPFRGKHYQIRSILQMQARSLVSFLRGRGEYRPFSFHW